MKRRVHHQSVSGQFFEQESFHNVQQNDALQRWQQMRVKSEGSQRLKQTELHWPAADAVKKTELKKKPKQEAQSEKEKWVTRK